MATLGDLVQQLDTAMTDVKQKQQARNDASAAATAAQRDLDTAVQQAKDLKRQIDASFAQSLGISADDRVR